MLQAALRSWLMALLLFVLLPGALTGGVVAALINGNLISLGSLVAFLAVYALAVRQSVVLLNRCQELQARGRRHDEPRSSSAAALRERLAPIGLTRSRSPCVFLPFLFMGDVAGTEIVEPMAAVIIGGLVTATVRAASRSCRRCTCASVPARVKTPTCSPDLTVTGFDDDVDPDEGAGRVRGHGRLRSGSMHRRRTIGVLALAASGARTVRLRGDAPREEAEPEPSRHDPRDRRAPASTGSSSPRTRRAASGCTMAPSPASPVRNRLLRGRASTTARARPGCT